MKTISEKPIALLSMPILSGEFPSFQLALLKPTLQRAGIDIQTFSMFMYFGTHIGWRLNNTLSQVRPCMAGEWIWSKAAFGDFADDDAYLHHYEKNFRNICLEAQCTIEDILDVRNRMTFSFLDFCLKSVDWSRFSMIGFSIVFQQMTSSLALAQRLKEAYPELPIIMGGATFEDDIAQSVMEGCEYIDYVHYGDADKSFPELIHRLRRGDAIDNLPGLMWREGDIIHQNGRAPNLRELDTTPTPDFDEYFYAREQSGFDHFEGARDAMLPIETARGCWWGMKNHCTFCGLNRAGMEFRAKSVDSVIEMITELSKKYGQLYFDAIDNIMSPEYIEELFGRLAAAHSDIRFHYEVRPNLSRPQLKAMRQGGLCSVQPGIESFSTHVLKLMKKHTTGVRNIAFLKWCTYYDINNLYNILLGFSGETIEDSKLQCELIPKMYHLQPPFAITQARADRGSPMFHNPESHGVQQLVPSYCYQFIFPTTRFELKRISYFFDHEQHNIPEDREYDEIYAHVYEWQQKWKRPNKPILRYYRTPQSIIFEDTRRGILQKSSFHDQAAELYIFCNDARTLQAIQDHFRSKTATATATDAETAEPSEPSETTDTPSESATPEAMQVSSTSERWIEDALHTFVQRDLMVFLDGRYLSLALPANSYV